jgi:hypothetical protein
METGEECNQTITKYIKNSSWENLICFQDGLSHPIAAQQEWIYEFL